MNNTFKLANYIINMNKKRYTKEILRNSSYFKKGDKPCKSNKDKHTMLTRDIATITNKKLNDRQKGLKVNLIMFISFYIMLIYFLFNVLL